MPDSTSPSRPEIVRLILVPTLITFAVTLLRLTGELAHWSERWFSTETGGTIPHGVSWFFGITWLAVPFGTYFAVRLVKAQQGPPSVAKALILSALGLLILAGFRFPIGIIPLQFPLILIPIWLLMAIAAFLQYFSWPSLFNTLLAYGLAARIPVAIVMFLAMLGNWGTHYDYVGMPPQFAMPLVPRFLWLALFPQLIFWVSFTIVVGTICGTLLTAVIRFGPVPARAELS